MYEIVSPKLRTLGTAAKEKYVREIRDVIVVMDAGES